MLLSKERIQGIIDLYNNNSIFSSDGTSPELSQGEDSIIELFTNYACADFAQAVYQITGWETVEFLYKENDIFGEFYHVVSKHPTEEIYFDINGFLTEDKIAELYFNNRNVIKYFSGLTSCALQKKEEMYMLSSLISEIIAKGWSQEYRQTIC